MNLIKKTIFEGSGELFIQLGDVRLQLPAKKVRDLYHQNAKDLIFGIRPEHVQIIRDHQSTPLTGKVTTTEIMGRETLLHIRISDHALLGLTADKKIKEGDIVGATPDTERAHFFNVNG